MALLSGARTQKNSALAQQLFARMTKHFPHKDQYWMSASVLLANTYAASGDSDKSTDLKLDTYNSGVKKQVGVSWTVVNGQFYVS